MALATTQTRVWTGNPDDKLMLKRADGQVGYWEGEA